MNSLLLNIPMIYNPFDISSFELIIINPKNGTAFKTPIDSVDFGNHYIDITMPLSNMNDSPLRTIIEDSLTVGIIIRRRARNGELLSNEAFRGVRLQTMECEHSYDYDPSVTVKIHGKYNKHISAIKLHDSEYTSFVGTYEMRYFQDDTYWGGDFTIDKIINKKVEEIVETYESSYDSLKDIADWIAGVGPEIEETLTKKETEIPFEEIKIKHYRNGFRGVEIH